MLLELVRSQCHSKTQMECVHAPGQCSASNSQDKIAKKHVELVLVNEIIPI